jgi:surfactin synthase thioesterase subunit
MLSVFKLKIDISSVIQQEPAIVNGQDSKAYQNRHSNPNITTHKFDGNHFTINLVLNIKP